MPDSISRSTIPFALVVAVCCGGTARAASGREFAMRGQDLVVNVDTRWAGCSNGGYLPVRVRVVNKGAKRNIGLRFQPGEAELLPTVETTLGVPQNSTVEATLPIPIVGLGSSGVFQVLVNGRESRDLRETIVVPGFDSYGGRSRPGVLIVSAGPVDAGQLEQGVNQALQLDHMHSGYGLTDDHMVLPPRSLPGEWMHYSGLDIVMIPLPILSRLEPDRRDALVDWVETGGTLVVTEVEGLPAESDDLERIVDLAARGATTQSWKRWSQVVPVGHDPRFFDSGNPFGDVHSRDLMLGRLVTCGGNPFPGEWQYWTPFLAKLQEEHLVVGPMPGRLQWPMRHGLTSRAGTSDFPEFLIPGVQSVPVNSMLALITLFTLVIGPLNYFVLWKRKQLNALILTIPVIAFVTSIVLFAYSAVAHGFGIRSRIRSVTILDERDHSAVTTTRVALFAGMAPGDGLRFSPRTAVHTLWPEGQSFAKAHVNWSETQHLDEGWLRSRTRTQFVTVRNHTERGRLDFPKGEGSARRVANGFEVGLRYLLFRDEDGRLLVAENVAAGDTKTLAPVETELTELRRLLQEHPLKVPDGILRGQSNWGLGDRYDWDQQQYSAARYAQSQSETMLRRVANSAEQLRLNSYVAVLAENPGVDIGLERTREEASLHVVFGYR